MRVAVTLLLLAFVPLARGGEPVPEAIPQTQTWAQLKASRVHEVATSAGPARVRIGIEHTRLVKGRTLTVFALVEGKPVKPHAHEYEEQLGPLVVRAVPLDEMIEMGGMRAAIQEIEKRPESEESRKPFHLYAMLIPIQSARRVAIRAGLPRNLEYLAEAEVQGQDGWTHPWTRLRLPDFDDEPEEPQTGTEGVVQGVAVYADWEPAYPRLDGSTPLLSFSAAELLAAQGPLPCLEGQRRALPLPDFNGAGALKGDRVAIAALVPKLGDAEFETREKSTALLHALLPEALSELKAARFSTVDPEARSRLETLLETAEATAQLKLRAEREEWTLEFSKKREFARYSSPEKILVRWWVNGRPVVKSVTDEAENVLHAFHERVELATTWKLAMNIDYAWLGARHGDSVSVQVLYAPAGIKSLNAEALHGIDCEGSQLPILSNISTFTLTRK